MAPDPKPKRAYKAQRRVWVSAEGKKAMERRCRIHNADCDGKLESAHIIPRRYDQDWDVKAPDIVPLCRHHHAMFDEKKLDLLPYLTRSEQAEAVRKVGVVRAIHYMTGTTVVWAGKEVV